MPVFGQVPMSLILPRHPLSQILSFGSTLVRRQVPCAAESGSAVAASHSLRHALRPPIGRNSRIGQLPAVSNQGEVTSQGSTRGIVVHHHEKLIWINRHTKTRL